MNIAPNPAAVALHTETQAIKASLAASEQALQAAHAAAAEPKPDVQAIGPGELETARLSDLAGLTVGRKDALLAQKTADAAALTAHAARVASAKADVSTHDAAVRFHTAALAEARKLELAAMSVAAQALQQPAAEAYAAALASLRTAAAELAAVTAIAGAADRLRTRGADLGVIDPPRGAFIVPALSALNSGGGLRQDGQWAPDQVKIEADVLSREASTLAESIMLTMKGLA